MVGQNTPNKRSQGNDAGQPTVYLIRIQGHLGLKWTEWFDGMTISLEENGNTLIAGPVVDQAPRIQKSPIWMRGDQYEIRLAASL
jgi:hypothetical protein